MLTHYFPRQKLVTAAKLANGITIVEAGTIDSVPICSLESLIM